MKHQSQTRGRVRVGRLVGPTTRKEGIVDLRCSTIIPSGSLATFNPRYGDDLRSIKEMDPFLKKDERRLFFDSLVRMSVRWCHTFLFGVHLSADMSCLVFLFI
jgi:hypothetical protein